MLAIRTHLVNSPQSFSMCPMDWEISSDFSLANKALGDRPRRAVIGKIDILNHTINVIGICRVP